MGGLLIVSHRAGSEDAQNRSALLQSQARDQTLHVQRLSRCCWIGSDSPVPHSRLSVGPWTLIGEVFNRSNPPVRRVSSSDPFSYEKKMLARFWGSFIGLRFDTDGHPAAVLRDPSGSLDLAVWNQSGLTVLFSDMPDWTIRLLKPAWSISVPKLRAALQDPFLVEDQLMLDGPVAVLPGTLQPLPVGEPQTLWRPDWLARPLSGEAVTVEKAASDVARSINEVVCAHARTDQVLACEVSGGLDSSVVACCLTQCDSGAVRLWPSAYGLDASGDERPYVGRLAAHLGIDVTAVPRAAGVVTREMLESMPHGLRPALAALDGLHDTDWAARFQAAGIERVLTGKGGDAVFIQPAGPEVFEDLWLREGWRGVFSPSLVALARWNERSVWSLLSRATRSRRRSDLLDEANRLLAPRVGPPARSHAWLEGIDDLGPGKQRQIRGLVQGVGFHGPSFQTQVARIIHPLLAQPVVETCLALSTPTLTLGRRDRGLLRRAFSDLLPDAIIQRRSKGEMTAFYGRMIAGGLDALKPWLLEGRLADHGLIDRQAAEMILSPESLIHRGGYVDIMVTAAFEGWVREWERRLATGR